MSRTRFVVLAVLAAALSLPGPAVAQWGILNDSEEPGSVLVFHKFIRGSFTSIEVTVDPDDPTNIVIVETAVPRTELEISVTCPKGSTCTRDPQTGLFQRVFLKAHWVCPGSRENPTCAEADFILQTTVNGTLYFNPENIDPSNVEPRSALAIPECDEGYLIVWVIDGSGQAIKFDALIGDAIIRTPTTVDGVPVFTGFLETGSAYNALPIQAAKSPILETGDRTNVDGDPQGDMDFDGTEYKAITGKIFGTVRYPDPTIVRVVNENGFATEFANVQTDLTLLTLDVKSNRDNNQTFVDLNFYNEFEDLRSDNTSFFCWTQISLTDINAGLTLQQFGRKGLVESTAAEKRQFQGVEDDTGPVTLVGIVVTREGVFLRDLDEPEEIDLQIRGYAYSLYHDSEPVPTVFVPTGTPPNGGGNSTPPPNNNTYTITFDDKNAGQTLNGECPAGVIDWGTDAWFVSGPWGAFTTNSISFNGAGSTSESFTFVSPKVLVSLQAYNGGSSASTVTVSCAGNPTQTVTVNAGSLVTISTGWTNACSVVTIGSSNGWETNFDNVTYR